MALMCVQELIHLDARTKSANITSTLLYNEGNLEEQNLQPGQLILCLSTRIQLKLDSTSSFALTTRPGPAGAAGGRPSKYDPRKKTGLLPAGGAGVVPRSQENGGGGATYIIGGGGIVNTNRTDGGLRGLGDEHLGEKLGRRRAEKRKKRDEEKETEEALKRLMARDGAAQSTGGRYLALAGVGVDGKKKKGVGHEGDDRKRAFSAQAIQRIGFDPTLHLGGRRPEDQSKRVSFVFGRVIRALADGNRLRVLIF